MRRIAIHKMHKNNYPLLNYFYDYSFYRGICTHPKLNLFGGGYQLIEFACLCNVLFDISCNYHDYYSFTTFIVYDYYTECLLFYSK